MLRICVLFADANLPFSKYYVAKGEVMDRIIKIGPDKNVVWYDAAANVDHNIICPLRAARRDDYCVENCAGYHVTQASQALCQFMSGDRHVIGVCKSKMPPEKQTGSKFVADSL